MLIAIAILISLIGLIALISKSKPNVQEYNDWKNEGLKVSKTVDYSGRKIKSPKVELYRYN